MAPRRHIVGLHEPPPKPKPDAREQLADKLGLRVETVPGLDLPQGTVVLPEPRSPENPAEPDERDDDVRLADLKNTVRGLMRAAGAAELTIEFDGSGDSGEITEVYYVNTADARQEAEGALDRVARELADAVLDQTEHDWWNNSGGWGSITVPVEPDEPVHLDINIRFEDSTNYSETF